MAYKNYVRKANDGRGKPRFFKSGKMLINKAKEYIDVCETRGKFANIAGFCVYCDINKDTYYACSEYYPEDFSKVCDLLEDSVLNSDVKKSQMAIFYLKNRHGYRDKIETENVNTNKNIDLSKVSDEIINKILGES